MRIQTATRKVDLPPNFLGLNAMVKLALVAGVKPWNIPGAIRMFMQILRVKEERDAVPYDSVPLRDFLSRYTADKGLHRLVDLFSVLLFVIAHEEASAGEFLWSFASMAKARSLGYRMRLRTGPLAITLYSFEEIVVLLADTHPRVDYRTLIDWLHKVMGDHEIADRIEDIVRL